MSFSIFKQSMLSYMENQNGIKAYPEFAKKITSEYDMCIRRGLQTVNNIPIQTPNIALMQTLVTLACSISLTKPDGKHTFADDIGKGVLGYWTGATLVVGIPPIIPAPGSMLNVSTTAAIVTSPGTWSPVGPLTPTDDSGQFLDKLITSMVSHLPTIQGLYMTMSLYPAAPPFVAPGVLTWNGFTVPPAGPGVVKPPPTSSFLGAINSVISAIASTLSDVLSPEDKVAMKAEKAEASAVANDTTLPSSGRSTAKEYVSLKSSELSSGTANATPVDLSEEELAAIEESTPDKYKCEDGTKIVAIAKRDIGILETGTPPGKNYGGFSGGVQKEEPGRIDEMFTNVGLDNQAKVRKSGSGYYWCAAAVATWWQEAGLQTPSGGASCDNWMSWGKSNGYWSTEPKIGAAILYGSTSDAHHIGIVAGVTPSGGVITIEGNTGGGGFSRNGCGVFQKVPKKYLGFVLPPSCV